MIDPQSAIELTQQLVRTPSEAGQEQRVAHFLLEAMPAYGYDAVGLDEFGSVTGIRIGDQPGPTLLLDAHIDTVGIAPGVPWQFDPFGGQISAGRIYGRGSSDMKGALAAMIVAGGRINPAEIAGRLVVSASVMEEVLEGAALEHIMETYQPDFVLIGEASDLKIVHGGRGRAEIRIEAVGKPAHSSSPAKGINAVEAILPVLTGIQNLELPDHPFIGEAIFALTDIISEPYPGHSVIPSRCRATYDRRLLPDETPEGVLEPLRQIRSLPGAAINVTIAEGEYHAWTGRTVNRNKWFPAWMLDKDHPLILDAVAALVRVGIRPEFSAYRFCTNAAYSAGVAGVPTFGFGPSREEIAHIADEYIEIDALVKAAQAYQAIIETVLGKSP